MKNTFIIVPGCSDLNRGDQALVWETKELAEKAGFSGKFYMISEKNEPVSQSEAQGIAALVPILEHPSTRFKSKKNIKYTKWLKLKWGLVAIIDMIWSLCLLNPITEKLVFPFLSSQKKQTLKHFKDSSAIFMKGGGLLQTYGGITSTYSMYFWTYTLFLAKSLKKPIYVMPNSFGPFKGPFVKSIARKALKNVNLLSSRESVSQNMLKKDLGLDSILFPDLAFFLKPSKKINLNNELLENRKKVAITVRPYRFPNSSNPDYEYKKYKNEIRKFANYLYKNGYMPVFVEHTLAINAHEDDGRCIREIVSKMDIHTYKVISDKKYNCKDLKEIYGQFDYIIGTRFHSMIFSFGMGIPGIAIAYTGNKSQGIMKDMGLSDYVVSIYHVTAENLIERFEKLVQSKDEVKQKINNYILEARKKRSNIIKYLDQKNEISICA